MVDVVLKVLDVEAVEDVELVLVHPVSVVDVVL